MIRGIIEACILTITIGFLEGALVEQSIAQITFMSPEMDPYLDDYFTTITRMTIQELRNLPKLSDEEFFDQINRGYDSVIVRSNGTNNSSNLFDRNIDEPLEFLPDIDSEWEDLMSSGPSSINLMGSMMAIASKKDFPLMTNFTYEHIKYPTSFQATLMQVANDMYKALYTAHTGMESIHINMHEIPDLLKTVFKLITQGSTTLNKLLLPRTLATIGRYVNESSTAARNSLQKFASLQELLHEVLTVTTMSNAENKNQAEELARESELLDNEKQEMDATLANLTQHYGTAREKLEKARELYNTAVSQIPNPHHWNQEAWNAYMSQRPAETCWKNWWGRRRCRSLREEQFAAYTAEAHWKAEQALAALNAAMNNNHHIFNQQVNQQNELNAVIQSLATMNLQALSLDETIKILINATKHIGSIQQQWSRISRFFNTLTINCEHTQQVVLHEFLGLVNEFEMLGQQLNPSDQSLFLALLVESATDIERDSHLLYMMAKTYFDVSNAYMIDQIAGLSVVLGLHTDAERDVYLRQVAQNTTRISGQIKTLAAERLRNYELINAARQEQYTAFIQQGMLQEELNALENIGIGK